MKQFLLTAVLMCKLSAKLGIFFYFAHFLDERIPTTAKQSSKEAWKGSRSTRGEKNVKKFIFIVYMKWRKKSWKESFQLRVPFTRLLSLCLKLAHERVVEQLRIIRCASFFIPPTNLSTLRQSLKEMKKLRKEMAKHFLFFAYSAHCLCLVLFFTLSIRKKSFSKNVFPFSLLWLTK